MHEVDAQKCILTRSRLVAIFYPVFYFFVVLFLSGLTIWLQELVFKIKITYSSYSQILQSNIDKMQLCAAVHGTFRTRFNEMQNMVSCACTYVLGAHIISINNQPVPRFFTLFAL